MQLSNEKQILKKEQLNEQFKNSINIFFHVDDFNNYTFSRKLPQVAVFTTGGTIAQKYDAKAGGLVPVVTGEDLIESVPPLKNLAKIDVFDVVNIDSSHMTLEIWAKLSKTIDEKLSQNDYIGAVVTHGTDTMQKVFISFL